MRGLYIITDCARLEFETVLERTGEMLGAGIAAVQYRDKETRADARIERARRLHDLCVGYRTPLIINDDPETLLAVGAEGLHVGRDDVDFRVVRQRLGASAVLGVSCYNDIGRALEAQTGGADYVAFGAFFPTDSKDRTTPVSTKTLAVARQKLSVPIAAIGGITPENCRPLLAAGADLLAVIGSVYQSVDPAATVCRFNELFREYEP